jgi:hypothetical protein
MNFNTPRIARHLRQRASASAEKYIDLAEDTAADKTIREESKIY